MHKEHKADALLKRAVSEGFSDLHLEPLPESLRIRVRKDGALLPYAEHKKAEGLAMSARIKLLCGMDLSQDRLPQDGALRIATAEGWADFRVSSLPYLWGEGLALRLLGIQGKLKTLDTLGLTTEQQSLLEGLLARREGLILATGRAGSGKTTLLYACLRALCTPERKVMSAEDPVEATLAGVLQLPITPQLPYPAALRALLRHSPDTLLIGEIRDPESAHIAVQAALTGHQILSSLHTKTPEEAALRLQNLGIAKSLVNATLIGTLGTQLVPHPSGKGRIGCFKIV